MNTLLHFLSFILFYNVKFRGCQESCWPLFQRDLPHGMPSPLSRRVCWRCWGYSWSLTDWSGRKGLLTLSESFQLGCTEAPVNNEWNIKLFDFLPLESINNVNNDQTARCQPLNERAVNMNKARVGKLRAFSFSRFPLPQQSRHSGTLATDRVQNCKPLQIHTDLSALMV